MALLQYKTIDNYLWLQYYAKSYVTTIQNQY